MNKLLMFEGFLEITPIAKGRPRMSTVTGKAYTPMKTAVYERTLKHLLYNTHRPNIPASKDVPICVRVTFFMPKLKTVKRDYPTGRPDLDNLFKAFADAANGMLWSDDSQIVEVLLSKRIADELVGIRYHVYGLI